MSKGRLRFANFHYQGNFYEIEISRGSVAQVIFQTENFAPVGPIQPVHTQMRFVLKPEQPALLRHQAGRQKGQFVGYLNDFVLSVDIMTGPGFS